MLKYLKDYDVVVGNRALKDSKVSLHLATKADCYDLFKWRCDPITNKFSFGFISLLRTSISSIKSFDKASLPEVSIIKTSNFLRTVIS